MGWSSNILVIPWWTGVRFCLHMTLSSSPARQKKGPITKALNFEGGHDGQAEVDLSSVTWRERKAVSFLIFSHLFQGLVLSVLWE